MRTIVALCCLTLCPFYVWAQQSAFLDVHFNNNFTMANNRLDKYFGPVNGLGNDIEQPSSYSPGITLLYTSLNSRNIGYRIGIEYLDYIQFTSSTVELEEGFFLPYTSRMHFHMLSVPVVANFAVNSGEETDKFFFHMGFGFKINYLMAAPFTITPQTGPVIETSYPVSDAFYRVSASYVLSVDIKFPINKANNLYLLIGGSYDGLVGGLEKPTYDPPFDSPSELKFPIGTLKGYYPNTHTNRQQEKFKTESLNMRLGVSFSLSS
ncbi:MAG: hypothetical protein HYZ16_10395 [Bacteroidetes bacterium]|nr:hypothetical protein [Bacteroidota bacterium]